MYFFLWLLSFKRTVHLNLFTWRHVVVWLTQLLSDQMIFTIWCIYLISRTFIFIWRLVINREVSSCVSTAFFKCFLRMLLYAFVTFCVSISVKSEWLKQNCLICVRRSTVFLFCWTCVFDRSVSFFLFFFLRSLSICMRPPCVCGMVL